MAGRLPLQGSEYYLPEETYRMVQHFCFSYKEMQTELMTLEGLRSPVIDDMPHGTTVGNPTERIGMRRAELSRKIDIIDTACREVSQAGYMWLWKGVTDKSMSYRALREKGMPYNHNQYGAMKRKVYWKVAQEI